jgi:hypothetical protein
MSGRRALSLLGRQLVRRAPPASTPSAKAIAESEKANSIADAFYETTGA